MGEKCNLLDDFVGFSVVVVWEYVGELCQCFLWVCFVVFGSYDEVVVVVVFGYIDLYFDDVFSVYYWINWFYYGYVRFEWFVDVCLEGGYGFFFCCGDMNLLCVVNLVIGVINQDCFESIVRCWVGSGFLLMGQCIVLMLQESCWIVCYLVVWLVINDDLVLLVFFNFDEIFLGIVFDLLDMIFCCIGLYFQVMFCSGGFFEQIGVLVRKEVDLVIMSCSSKCEEMLCFICLFLFILYVFVIWVDDKGCVESFGSFDGKCIVIFVGYVGM